MIKRFLRELYLLPRGEQRALILVSLLLILSVFIRIGVQLLPGRDPPGMEEFVQESRMLMVALAEADSLERSTYGGSSYPKTFPTGRSTLPRQTIDINRADSARLLPLPGIGPVLAGRIIKYRNLLGGYYSTNQLEEVYGLNREIVELVSDRILIDTDAIRKIFVDSASFRDMLRHPYLEYEDVKQIVKYRDLMGSVSSVMELRQNGILADSTLEKIGPYLLYRTE